MDTPQNPIKSDVFPVKIAINRALLSVLKQILEAK